MDDGPPHQEPREEVGQVLEVQERVRPCQSARHRRPARARRSTSRARAGSATSGWMKRAAIDPERRCDGEHDEPGRPLGRDDVLEEVDREQVVQRDRVQRRDVDREQQDHAQGRTRRGGWCRRASGAGSSSTRAASAAMARRTSQCSAHEYGSTALRYPALAGVAQWQSDLVSTQVVRAVRFSPPASHVRRCRLRFPK